MSTITELAEPRSGCLSVESVLVCVNNFIGFNKAEWLFFGATCFHVDTHPLGVTLHHSGVVAFAYKLVLANHVGFTIVVADPGCNPERVASEGGALVFHVVLTCHAAISQLYKVLKGKAELSRVQSRDGLHPHQVNGVVGVLEFIEMFGLYGKLADELWGAIPNTGVSVGDWDGFEIAVFENF